MTNGPGTGRERLGEAARLPAKVFISYAHDDSAHEDRVRIFWRFLREQGVDAHVDLPAAGHRLDWTEWMTQQIRDADYVLVIASPAYKRRAEGQATPGDGRGVQWEARLIRDRFYADQATGLRSIVPVVLPGCSASDIPLWMGTVATTHYLVRDYTVTGAEKLLRLLTSQPAEVVPPLGKPPVLPPRPAQTSAPGPFIGSTPRRTQRLTLLLLLSAAGLAVLVLVIVAVSLNLAKGPGRTTPPPATPGYPPSHSVASDYTRRYSEVPFTMRGGGCPDSLSTSAWVTFIGSGPDAHVTTLYTSGYSFDLQLDCNNGQGSGIDFGADPVATVTRSPGASACELAITRHPVYGSLIPFSTLSKGMQFCVSAESGLLARVTLTSVNDTTYDLAWTVTAWAPPA